MKIGNNLLLVDCYKSATAIKLGIDNMPLIEHLDAIKTIAKTIYDPLCSQYKVRVPITSFYRCPELNKRIGGSKTSQHCKGEAIDLDFDQMKVPFNNKDLFYFIKDNLIFDQLIWEFGTNLKPDWVHVSFTKKNVNRGIVTRGYRNSKGETGYEPF